MNNLYKKDLEDWFVMDDQFLYFDDVRDDENIRLSKEKRGLGYRLYVETGFQNFFCSKEWIGNIDMQQHLVLLWTQNYFLIWKFCQFKRINLRQYCSQFLALDMFSIEKIQDFIRLHHQNLIEKEAELESFAFPQDVAREYYTRNYNPHDYPELLVPFNKEYYHIGHDVRFCSLLPFQEFCEWGCMEKTPDFTDCYLKYGKKQLQQHLIFSTKVQQFLLKRYAEETATDVIKKQIFSAIKDVQAKQLTIVYYDTRYSISTSCKIDKEDLIRQLFTAAPSSSYFHLTRIGIGIQWKEIKSIEYRKKKLYSS